jgi:hypothetical protein
VVSTILEPHYQNMKTNSRAIEAQTPNSYNMINIYSNVAHISTIVAS